VPAARLEDAPRKALWRAAFMSARYSENAKWWRTGMAGAKRRATIRRRHVAENRECSRQARRRAVIMLCSRTVANRRTLLNTRGARRGRRPVAVMANHQPEPVLCWYAPLVVASSGGAGAGITRCVRAGDGVRCGARIRWAVLRYYELAEGYAVTRFGRRGASDAKAERLSPREMVRNSMLREKAASFKYSREGMRQ